MNNYRSSLLLSTARAGLLAQIRNRPAPAEPKAETAARPATRNLCQGRLRHAQRVLRAVKGNVQVAAALSITPQTVGNWRRGANAPTVAHWRQIRALGFVLTRAGVRIDSGIRVIDLVRPDAAD